MSIDIRVAVTDGVRRVATHFNTDIDALMSVCLWAHLVGCRVADLALRFVPSGVKELEEGEVGLDVSAGLKGADSSCFEELLSFATEADRAALSRFAAYVTLQDQGECFKLSPELQTGTLGGVLGALRIAGKTDAQLIGWAEEIFLAQLAAGRQRLAAEQALAATRWFAGRRIAVLPPGAPGGATAAAFEVGAELVVYQDGLNVGLLRTSKLTEPHLGELLGTELPAGFYLDQRGFMVAWGTRKSPATQPSPLVGEQLAELLAAKLD